MATIDIIIPTLKRPEHLRRCLESLCQQELRATRIRVGVRSDDELTPPVIAE